MFSVGTSPTSLDCGWSEIRMMLPPANFLLLRPLMSKLFMRVRPTASECKAGKRKGRAGAARIFVSDIEQAGRGGENDKCKQQGSANSANLTAKDQQFTWPVHALHSEQRDEHRRNDNGRADGVCEPGRDRADAELIQEYRGDACESDRDDIGADRNQLDRSISDWPFSLSARRRAVVVERNLLVEAGCNLSVNKIHARTRPFKAFCNAV